MKSVLCWRGTFLDVKSVPSASTRSRSLPAPNSLSSVSEEVFGDEKDYTHSLARNQQIADRQRAKGTKKVASVAKYLSGAHLESPPCKEEPFERSEELGSFFGPQSSISTAASTTRSPASSWNLQGNTPRSPESSWALTGSMEVPGERNSFHSMNSDGSPKLEVLGMYANPLSSGSEDDDVHLRNAANASPFTAEAVGQHRNPGSLGHPVVCSRPCLFFATGRCQSGSDCTYCHYTHTQRLPHLDKRGRRKLASMAQEDVLAAALPVLQEKARQLGFLQEAKDVLDVLAKCMRNPPSSPKDQSSPCPLKHFFDLLPFNSLLGMVKHGMGEENLARLHIELDCLRRRVSERAHVLDTRPT
mmetsp:Transcript_44518/g.105499  ORF Transcript_44518/g.105499 Transcript_44518/m.105499 type:complete len:359 (+) Transcript_44518:112-1188(+)